MCYIYTFSTHSFFKQIQKIQRTIYKHRKIGWKILGPLYHARFYNRFWRTTKTLSLYSGCMQIRTTHSTPYIYAACKRTLTGKLAFTTKHV